MKLFIVAVVLVICGSLVAGCGGSRRLSLAAERAAIASGPGTGWEYAEVVVLPLR
jgi:hypothetical protein